MPRTLEAVLGPISRSPCRVRREPGRAGRCAGQLLIRSPNVFRRLLTAPGELGFGRAYVAGELDFEGGVYAALSALRDRTPDVRAFGAALFPRGRAQDPQAAVLDA